MDAFQSALDDLLKESKEQITLVQARASAAVLAAHVVPHRIAVAIGQRFTRERVESAFPVLCFLDGTLNRTSSSPGANGPAEQALQAVLASFWELAPTVFTSMHAYGAAHTPWRDKVLRLLRRWKQRQLVSDEIGEAVLRAVEVGGAPATPEPNTETEEGEGSPSPLPKDKEAERREGAAAPKAGTASSSGSSPQPQQQSVERAPAVIASSFTAAEAQAFRATLQACASALEALPPHRAALYLELIRSQHQHAPTRAARQFFDDLLAELHREVTAASSGTATHTSMTSASSAKTSFQEGGAEGGSSSSGHAREALGKLLNQLQSSEGEEGSAGRGRGTASRRGPASATATAATTVVRYVSPIFSDLYGKQPLAQRGAGFGPLQRKAGHGVVAGGGSHPQEGTHSSNNSFYTSYYPKSVANAQRPFRIPPARQAHGGCVRVWFPRPDVWVSTQDMAELVQFASRTNTERELKRARTEAP